MSRVRAGAAGLAAIAAALVGCVPDSDPRWQLDHDRVVAARATPPHVPAGASAVIDGLLAHKGAPTTIEPPVHVMPSPTTPAALAGVVAAANGGWQVTAPSQAVLDGVRAELALPAGAAIPLVLVETFGPIPLTVSQTMYLGDTADNPTPGTVQVEGVARMPDSALMIPADTDVPIAVETDAANDVNWLTSCGTMHDDNEHAGFVHVEPDDPQSGELVVVVRAPDGGVGWQRWALAATPAPVSR